jgi:hypothetical protein
MHINECCNINRSAWPFKYCSWQRPAVIFFKCQHNTCYKIIYVPYFLNYMIYNHDFFTVILGKDEFINLPYNMSALYIRDATYVRARLVYRSFMVSMTLRISA